MTELLDEAIAKVARLPDHEQDAFARWLMDELESERRWSRAVVRTVVGGRTMHSSA